MALDWTEACEKAGDEFRTLADPARKWLEYEEVTPLTLATLRFVAAQKGSPNEQAALTEMQRAYDALEQDYLHQRAEELQRDARDGGYETRKEAEGLA